VQFEVDRVLTPAEDQAAVYNEVAQPVVEAVALGATGCIMCYGQTGSGKTYTLAGGGGGAGGGANQMHTLSLRVVRFQLRITHPVVVLIFFLCPAVVFVTQRTRVFVILLVGCFFV
jgi:hypothetical protein